MIKEETLEKEFFPCMRHIEPAQVSRTGSQHATACAWDVGINAGDLNNLRHIEVERLAEGLLTKERGVSELCSARVLKVFAADNINNGTNLQGLRRENVVERNDALRCWLLLLLTSMFCTY